KSNTTSLPRVFHAEKYAWKRYHTQSEVPAGIAESRQISRRREPNVLIAHEVRSATRTERRQTRCNRQKANAPEFHVTSGADRCGPRSHRPRSMPRAVREDRTRARAPRRRTAGFPSLRRRSA